MKKALILSAFPGTGKSYFCNHTNKLALDSDSSKFDKKYFPNNYIQHIKDNLNKVDIICVSSHQATRLALLKEQLPFILVYPSINLKQEYLERYRQRKSTQQFIDIIDINWNNWIIDMQKTIKCTHIILKSQQFLSGAIDDYFSQNV